MKVFSIDCHACGARNTIDSDTMRRLEPLPVVHLGRPDPAGDSDSPCSKCGQPTARCWCRPDAA